jgi:hypothetical protein
MYAGPECGRGAIEGANYGLAAATEEMEPKGSLQIKKIYSLHPSKVRVKDYCIVKDTDVVITTVKPGLSRAAIGLA